MQKLLIADDDSGFRDFVETVARESGYDVRTVSDGRSVEDAVEDFGPHVILVDMVLPGLDGIEVIRTLASKDVTARFVLVSGHSPTYLNAGRAIAAASGFDDVRTAQKPVSLADLRELLS